MTADLDLIAHLNAVLKNTLTGINQYFLHARVLKHREHVKLADYEYKISIDAMKHSDMLVEHVLTLGGLPNMQELGRLMIGETMDAMLTNDLAHMETSILRLKTAIAYCESAAHPVTSLLLNRILESQQEHAGFIRSQIPTTHLSRKDCA